MCLKNKSVWQEKRDFESLDSREQMISLWKMVHRLVDIYHSQHSQDQTGNDKKQACPSGQLGQRCGGHVQRGVGETSGRWGEVSLSLSPGFQSWIYINRIPSNILTMFLVQIQRQGRGGWGKGVCEGGWLRGSPWQVPPCSRWEGPGRVAARWPSTTTATSSTESTSRQGRGEAGTWKWWRWFPTEMSIRGLPPVKALPLWRKANWSIFQLKSDQPYSSIHNHKSW